MVNLFVFLFLLAAVLLVWGLVNPASLSRFFKKSPTRKEISLWFGGALVAMFVMIGVTAPDTQSSLTDTTTSDQASTIDQESAQAEERAPIIETVTETEEVPYSSTTREDSTVSEGTKTITTYGVNGVKTLTYEVTKVDGEVTEKKLVKEEITKQPVTQVTTIGTKVAVQAQASSSCDPNYSGCVPIASDVDCAGGSGNGPAYVSGPVTVIGSDIYRLDADNDGIGCE